MHNKVLHKTETSQVFELKIKIKHKSNDKKTTGKEYISLNATAANSKFTLRPRTKTNNESAKTYSYSTCHYE